METDTPSNFSMSFDLADSDVDLTKTTPEELVAARAAAPAERRKLDYTFMTVILLMFGAVGGISSGSVKYKKGRKNNKKPSVDIEGLDVVITNSPIYPNNNNNIINGHLPQTDAADPLPVVIFGRWYDFAYYANEHPGGVESIRRYADYDVSGMWQRTPPGSISFGCLNSNTYLDIYMSQSTPVCSNPELICHNHISGTFWVYQSFKEYYLHDYFVTQAELEASGITYVIMDGYIYDVGTYVNGLWDNDTNSISTDYSHPNAYLQVSLHELILSGLNSDVTDLYYDWFGTSGSITCLDELFYYARLDTGDIDGIVKRGAKTLASVAKYEYDPADVIKNNNFEPTLAPVTDFIDEPVVAVEGVSSESTDTPMVDRSEKTDAPTDSQSTDQPVLNLVQGTSTPDNLTSDTRAPQDASANSLAPADPSNTSFSPTTDGEEDRLYMTLFGRVYDLTEYASQHPGGAETLDRFAGTDVSRFWARMPAAELPAECLDSTKEFALSLQRFPICSQMGILEKYTEHCHTSSYGRSAFHEYFKDYYIEDSFVSQSALLEQEIQYIVIDGHIYDVTLYTNKFRDFLTGEISMDPSNMYAYLHPDLHSLILSRLSADATDLYYETFVAKNLLYCLDELFYYARLADSST